MHKNRSETEPTRVLLIDASASDAEALRVIFEEGWAGQFTIAHSPDMSAALEHLSKEQVDAVLLDIGQPDTSGFDMVLRLRESFPSVPVVVLTDTESDEIAMRAIQCGAQDYILKGHLVGRRITQAICYAIARQSQIKTYKTEADTDPLTGVFNRRAFDERCLTEISRSSRHGDPLSCALLDIDLFKDVNDSYGHSIGDAVLQAVAEVLRENTRQSDVICRYGGDEFCILLTEANEADAARWAERVRESIRDLRISAGQNSVRFRATIGVSEWKTNITLPKQLVDLADQALLTAKHAGRDKVLRFGSLTDLDSFSGLDEGRGQSLLKKVLAREVMTSPVVCLTQLESLQDAADLFLRMRINSAPVVDVSGKLVGILSEKDLLTASLANRSWQTPVQRVMTVNVVSYNVDVPAIKIWEFLSRVTIRRVVIVNEKIEPVGVVSRGSLLRWVGNWGIVFSKSDPNQEKGVPVVPCESFAKSTAAIRSEIERLRDELDTESWEVVPSVVHAATRMQEHVQDLLALSQVTYQFTPGSACSPLLTEDPNS